MPFRGCWRISISQQKKSFKINAVEKRKNRQQFFSTDNLLIYINKFNLIIIIIVLMYFNTYMNGVSCGVYDIIYVSVLSIGAVFPQIRQRMTKTAYYII